MRWAALIVGIVIALALVWQAGEEHYRGCVQANGASYSTGTAGPSRRKYIPLSKADRVYVQGNAHHCSRLPF